MLADFSTERSSSKEVKMKDTNSSTPAQQVHSLLHLPAQDSHQSHNQLHTYLPPKRLPRVCQASRAERKTATPIPYPISVWAGEVLLEIERFWGRRGHGTFRQREQDHEIELGQVTLRQHYILVIAMLCFN